MADSDAAAGPLLASGASTHWKRAEDAPRRAREPIVERDGAGAASYARASRPLDREDESASRVASRPPRKPTKDETLKKLLADARSRLASLSTYQVNITRVERVGGQLQAEEDALLSIRRNPKAVRLEWANGPSKGREVIYSSAINDRMMYVNMANSSLPIPRMTIPVDSPLVLQEQPAPDHRGRIRHDHRRPEPVHGFREGGGESRGQAGLQGVSNGPRGWINHATSSSARRPRARPGRFTWIPRTLLPAVVAAYQTAGGELIERYTYRNVRPNPVDLASADAFDPDKRWGEAKGWLSRLARNAGASADAKPGQTTTR